MSSSYITKNHKKFYIKIHLILVCKYRKKLLLNGIEDFVKQTIFDISKTSDFTIDIMETDKVNIITGSCKNSASIINSAVAKRKNQFNGFFMYTIFLLSFFLSYFFQTAYNNKKLIVKFFFYF